MEMAEATAARGAILIAQELSIHKLRVGNALKASDRCKISYENVIEETRRQRLHLQQCQFQYVRREGNKLAHVLARGAVLFADRDVWAEKLPSHLDDVFQIDFIQ